MEGSSIKLKKLYPIVHPIDGVKELLHIKVRLTNY